MADPVVVTPQSWSSSKTSWMGLPWDFTNGELTDSMPTPNGVYLGAKLTAQLMVVTIFILVGAFSERTNSSGSSGQLTE